MSSLREITMRKLSGDENTGAIVVLGQAVDNNPVSTGVKDDYFGANTLWGVLCLVASMSDTIASLSMLFKGFGFGKIFVIKG
jgi:hypothetical protein